VPRDTLLIIVIIVVVFRFVLGCGRGLIGAFAQPVAGALGAVATVAESVDASTHYWDKRPIGRRFALRPLREDAAVEVGGGTVLDSHAARWVCRAPKSVLRCCETTGRATLVVAIVVATPVPSLR
jgi:hypothetical protein